MAASMEIIIKWSGKEYKIDSLNEDECVSDLKLKIKKETGVLCDRQKLLGLKFKGEFMTEFSDTNVFGQQTQKL